MADPRHRAPHRTERAIERELAEAERLHVDGELAARAQDPERDRQVEACAFLAPLGRREVHGHAAERELVARIADRRAHALTRLLHRGVGKADDDERGQPVGDVDLDRDERGLESPESARPHARDGAHFDLGGRGARLPDDVRRDGSTVAHSTTRER